MSTPEDPFLRLSQLARRAPLPPPGELPPGLATRVLAQIRAEENADSVSLWERLSLRALPLATGAAAICLLLSYAKQDGPRADTELLVQHLLTAQFQP